MHVEAENGAWLTCRLVRLAAGLLLLSATSGVMADNDPAARFRGEPPFDLAVTNVEWEPATEAYSYVTFDLSWSHSWRARWTEAAADNVTEKPLEVENWDAAWVFVKFLPEKDSKKSIQRNHWQHATLSTSAEHHVMPAGATNTVGLTDDGRAGVGVFVYRDAIGYGPNDFKGVKLRWLHGADKVDPTKAAIKAHAISMVYVPECPFKVGAPLKMGIAGFADGPKRPIVGGRLPGKENTLWPPGSFGAFTDGAWRGGEPMIPFLVDAAWSGPVAEGTDARRIGPRPGRLWGNLVYDTHNRGLSHGWGSMDPVNDNYPPATLHNDYPTGYAAFYCMKHYLTQVQYAAFLNSLPPDLAAKRAFISGDGDRPTTWNTNLNVYVEKREVNLGAGYRPHVIEEWDGHTITSSGDKMPKIPISIDAGVGEKLDGLDDTDAAGDDILDDLMKDAMASEKNALQRPPVYTARVPDRLCNWINWSDGLAYAVWAGLRPMTELEFAKVCRGPLHPVPDEWVPPSRKRQQTATDCAQRATATTYWGARMKQAQVVTVGKTLGRAFRGTHGDGTVPPGTPGARLQRGGTFDVDNEVFDTAPADWPTGQCLQRRGRGSGRGYIGLPKARYQTMFWGGARTAARKASQHPPKTVAADEPQLPVDAARDTIKITNLRWKADTEAYSHVSFDLAWDNSWRAAWTEPAERNVTGQPLDVESWDAAWVFVKFRPAGKKGLAHATLSPDSGEHRVPAGAALDVGLSDDRRRGIGVFIYRDAVGHGPNDFKNVTLRWLHGEDQADPTQVSIQAHAIAMVYVPGGPFKSKSPLRQVMVSPGTSSPTPPRHPLTLIDTADATRPGGYFASAGEYVPDSGDWPNGYRAFYCMKSSISQRQFVTFLNSVRGLDYGKQYLIGVTAYETSKPNNAKTHYGRLYGLSGYTIRRDTDGVYKADVPDRHCNFLSWPDVMSYSAWAGLRPPTSLEYEKACRGPRDFSREEDAWAEGACALATGLPGLVGPATSYWGIRQLSLSGCVHEWPGTIGNGARRSSLDFQGTHGSGMPEAPQDWPANTAFGEWFYMSWETTPGFCSIGVWVIPSEMGRVRRLWMTMDADRTGRYGARAVRTAPVQDAKDSPLQLDPLPDLLGQDVSIFYLSGRFRNDGDEPLKVEVTSPLGDACFPEGAASRVFTAVPNATTPFRILTAVTRQAAADAVRKGRVSTLPVRVGIPGGDVLAEWFVLVPSSKTDTVTPTVIGSVEGGDVSLRVLNATDRPHTLNIEMPSPPGVKMATTSQRFEFASAAEHRASFPVPPQVFGSDGLCRIPYRVTVADGVPQDGETAADLRVHSRWWVSRRIKKEPKPGAGDPDAVPGDGDPDGEIAGLDFGSIISAAGDIFKADKLPEGWERAIYGEEIPFGNGGPLPSPGSLALAATRVKSPADRKAVLHVNHALEPMGQGKSPPRFTVRVWLNDDVVYDARSIEPTKGKKGEESDESGAPVRIRKGINTMLVECQSEEAVPANPGNITVRFHDPEDGTPLGDLMFDMERR